jgi:hypothetical protein
VLSTAPPRGQRSQKRNSVDCTSSPPLAKGGLGGLGAARRLRHLPQTNSQSGQRAARRLRSNATLPPLAKGGLGGLGAATHSDRGLNALLRNADKQGGGTGHDHPPTPLCKGGKPGARSRPQPGARFAPESKSQEPSRGAGVLCRRIQVVRRCRCGLVDVQEESLAAIFLCLTSQAGFLKKFP